MKNKFPVLYYYLDFMWPYWVVQMFFLGSGKVGVLWLTLNAFVNLIGMYVAYLQAKTAIHISDSDS